ncbi:hypothetical protein LUZ60_009083 [Juncus effusus]|nr:hypothetical protein LUZ60_009083 [Juncus effusus]
MEQRNWAELNGELLLVIFQKVGTFDVLKSAEFVCRSWRKVAKDEPEVWRRIDMTTHNGRFNPCMLSHMTRLAIDRSKGRLEDFCVGSSYNDYFLKYLCDRTSVLKSLRLISCDRITVKGIINTIKRQPLLDNLEIALGPVCYKLRELVWKELPNNLKRFELNNDSYCSFPLDNKEAFGIARTMRQLRYLRLSRNSLSNEGLKAILEGCPHLETLDIQGCRYVNMDSDMRARCARLTNLRYWRKVAKNEVWRRIDVTNHGYSRKSLRLKDPIKLAIDRSKGRLEQYWIESFDCDLLLYLFDRGTVEELCDDLLKYLCGWTRVLKSLRLTSCNRVSNNRIVKMGKNPRISKDLNCLVFMIGTSARRDKSIANPREENSSELQIWRVARPAPPLGSSLPSHSGNFL